MAFSEGCIEICKELRLVPLFLLRDQRSRIRAVRGGRQSRWACYLLLERDGRQHIWSRWSITRRFDSLQWPGIAKLDPQLPLRGTGAPGGEPCARTPVLPSVWKRTSSSPCSSPVIGFPCRYISGTSASRAHHDRCSDSTTRISFKGDRRLPKPGSRGGIGGPSGCTAHLLG